MSPGEIEIIRALEDEGVSRTGLDRRGEEERMFQTHLLQVTPGLHWTVIPVGAATI